MKKILRPPLLAALLVVTVLASSACQPFGNDSPAAVGIWITHDEIRALPTTGAAWLAVKEASASTWGTPTIADQDSDHDVKTLAGALVAVRLRDAKLAAKVREHVMALVRHHPYDRVLSLARQLPSYIIAAELVGLNKDDRRAFSAFLREAASHKMEGHSGGDDLRSTALRSANNWGTMSRGAMAAIDVYLGDDADLANIANAQKAWLGASAPNSLRYSDTNWHGGAMAGVNPRSATRSGQTLSGVIAEDQRRTGEFQWPAPKGSYPHEALQGAVVASVILDRAGVLPFETGDNALVRAERWLTDVNANPADNDDRSTPWLLNRYGGGGFRTSTPTSPGKNMGWADWTVG